MSPYHSVELLLPGRHAEDTAPKGGDFVVCLSDEKARWTKHQFSHIDIFRDIQKKYDADPVLTSKLMNDYLDVIHNDKHVPIWEERLGLPGLHPQTFLYGVQCLGVAEHRRYHQYESKFGGRYLPLRFAAGIAEGIWNDTSAAERQKRGRPGVEWLEKDFGKPLLTSELMNK